MHRYISVCMFNVIYDVSINKIIEHLKRILNGYYKKNFCAAFPNHTNNISSVCQIHIPSYLLLHIRRSNRLYQFFRSCIWSTVIPTIVSHVVQNIGWIILNTHVYIVTLAVNRSMNDAARFNGAKKRKDFESKLGGKKGFFLFSVDGLK